MGFNPNAVELLIQAKEHGVNFKRSIAIGRQGLHLSEQDFRSILLRNSLPEIEFEHYFEPFFRLLGAEVVDSIDASTYENATVIQDMNLPIADVHKQKYSLVVDGGSLEHIFNFPTAIRNCMELVEEGGHFIGITPANNFFGHGFYQFSPELFYRIFSQNNGFRMVKMYLFTYSKNDVSEVFEVVDPDSVGKRVTLQNAYRTYLFFIAKRENITELFAEPPQQSDYENLVWQGEAYPHQQAHTGNSILEFIRKLIPKWIRLKLLRTFEKYKLIASPVGLSEKAFIFKPKSNAKQ